MKGKVIVTGGCGFIGSHVVDELLARGYRVKILSRPLCDMKNIQHVKDKVEHVDCDMTDLNKLKKHVDRDAIGIIHFAALINIDQSLEDPWPFFEINVKGTMNLLNVAKESGIQRFLHMSTCEVYGNVNGLADENHPVNPRSPYAVSKLAAEKYVQAHTFSYPLQPRTIIIRGFNQFGPRQSAAKFGAVIPKFIVAALKGEKLNIFGNGTQRRDYVYVKDTVRGIVDAFEKDLGDGETINLGSGKNTSINEIAESICRLTGRDPKETIVHINPRPGEVSSFGVDSSKAKKLLDWEPKYTFDQGLKETVEWFKKNI